VLLQLERGASQSTVFIAETIDGVGKASENGVITEVSASEVTS
jgi:hypothetical protein